MIRDHHDFKAVWRGEVGYRRALRSRAAGLEGNCERRDGTHRCTSASAQREARRDRGQREGHADTPRPEIFPSRSGA
jgi:hypothetical protein